MRPSRQSRLLTITFLVWFATWVVAGRYVSVGFYRFALGSAAPLALGLLTLIMALALVLTPFIRPEIHAKPRWLYAAVGIGSLTLIEFFWRVAMNELPWDFAKRLGIVLDVATPALLALGVAAVVVQWRSERGLFPPNDAAA